MASTKPRLSRAAKAVAEAEAALADIESWVCAPVGDAMVMIERWSDVAEMASSAATRTGSVSIDPFLLPLA